MSFAKSLQIISCKIVLILIILEVLYEGVLIDSHHRVSQVLILIILEVLYELAHTKKIKISLMS